MLGVEIFIDLKKHLIAYSNTFVRFIEKVFNLFIKSEQNSSFKFTKDLSISSGSENFHGLDPGSEIQGPGELSLSASTYPFG